MIEEYRRDVGELELPPVIGLLGASGAGKSTCAKHLKGVYEYRLMSTAKPIKDMLEVLGLTKEDLYGSQEFRKRPNARLCGKSSRQATVTLGTEWGRRMIGEDVWVNALQREIIQYQTWAATAADHRRPAHAGVLIDDIRFPNEAQMVRRLGGILIRLSRPKVERTPTLLDRAFHRAPLPYTVKDAIFSAARGHIVHESEFHYHYIKADATIDVYDDVSETLRQFDSLLLSHYGQGDD